MDQQEKEQEFYDLLSTKLYPIVVERLENIRDGFILSFKEGRNEVKIAVNSDWLSRTDVLQVRDEISATAIKFLRGNKTT